MKKIKYSNEKISEIPIVNNFLLKLEYLKFKEDIIKVRLNLSKWRIEFFKKIAQENGSQYQEIIGNLLDMYASHYSQKFQLWLASNRFLFSKKKYPEIIIMNDIIIPITEIFPCSNMCLIIFVKVSENEKIVWVIVCCCPDWLNAIAE